VALGQLKREFICKTARAKWIGGVAQMVEHLLCKCKSPEFKT
jgi:hypothetical protein